MSTVASAYTVSIDGLRQLDAVAVPTKGLFGGIKDQFPAVFRRVATPLAMYPAPGHVLATLLCLLKDRGIDLLKGDYDATTDRLSSARQTTFVTLTTAHKQHAGSLKTEAFDRAELRRYYEEFNATAAEGVDEPMAAGIGFLAAVLEAVDSQQVGLLVIG